VWRAHRRTASTRSIRRYPLGCRLALCMCHCRTSPLLWAWAYIRLAGTSHACSFEAEIHAPMHARHNQPVVAAREISPTTLRGARAVAFVVVVFLIVETATRDQTGRAEPPSAASTSRRPHLPCTCATSRSFQNQHPVRPGLRRPRPRDPCH
jgi:hypothetical protein